MLCAQAEPVVRMFEILRKYECQWVAQADLKSMLAGILLSHPGLEFLQVGRPGVGGICPAVLFGGLWLKGRKVEVEPNL